uniref:Uncharacterized protein n=1 Tax=Ralstonia solanacearum CFBP2957 TaxID=859656 RepID=D8P667_RALSL|nr:conserved protein of unknown function [Ralstonia solanacearum CFBP2957]
MCSICCTAVAGGAERLAPATSSVPAAVVEPRLARMAEMGRTRTAGPLAAGGSSRPSSVVRHRVHTVIRVTASHSKAAILQTGIGWAPPALKCAWDAQVDYPPGIIGSCDTTTLTQLIWRDTE